MSEPSATQAFTREEQGFTVQVLQNTHVEVSVVPELGAKVISLVNRRSGREWLWHPPGPLKLFGNRLGDNFATSTLVGWDECLPTIAPCWHTGRSLPDHGEVWSVPWQCDPAAWQRGVVHTSVRLAVSPLQFERRIELRGQIIQLDYQLTNLGDSTEEFLWAMHPLLALCPGDRLELGAATRGLLADDTLSKIAAAPWDENLDFNGGHPACAKVFAGPLREKVGRAAVANAHTGDRLAFEWDTSANHSLGVWLTRGGWNNHHHLAIEPTNGAPDALSTAATEAHRCGRIEPQATLSWQVMIRIDAAAGHGAGGT
jgi:galactose mutarotase-like enzyme